MPPPASTPTSVEKGGRGAPASRRRQRVDSDSSNSQRPHQSTLSFPSSSSKPDAKRFKFGAQQEAPTPPPDAANMMSTANPGRPGKGKGKGKLPAATIDLTQQHQNAFRPGAGAKKLVIKNMRTQPAAATAVDQTEQYYERARTDLESALAAVFRGEDDVAAPLERLYRGVEDICRRGTKQADDLYRMVRDKCDGHLWGDVLPIIQATVPDGANASGVDFTDVLRSVLEQWHIWNRKTMKIRSIFSYLDRTYLLRDKTLSSINDLTISQFRKAIGGSISNPQSPWTHALVGICNLVACDRSHDSRFDPGLLRDAIMMLHVSGLYQKSFEPAFIDDSAQYFSQFAHERRTWSLKAYILSCEKLLKDEDYRCNAFNFDSTTKKQLLSRARKILIEDYSGKLLDGGSVSQLLADKEVESMNALYGLLLLSKIQTKLKEPWAAHILSTGGAIVGDTSRGEEMVVRLLQLRRSLDVMIRDAFGGDEAFAFAMRQNFSAFMNDSDTARDWSMGTSKIGEMIAKHIDVLLRGGLKALPAELLSDERDRSAAEQSGQSGTGDEEAELDRQLDAALELFRFIEGKDAFEAFYKKDLSRRLLLGKSASSDAEQNMLRKLRDECGNNFTRNLEQMFKDQELAKGEMAAYKDWVQNSGRDGGRGAVELQVTVISASSWPSCPDVRLNIPAEVAGELRRFEGWYHTKHDGRKLSWPHSLAHCLVIANFPKGQKELLVSAYQAVVLMLFNDAEADAAAGPSSGPGSGSGSGPGADGAAPLSYEQISSSTMLQGPDLVRTLQSLACGKVKVLTKHPKGPDVNPTDTFTVNRAFTNPKRRVKINQIQLKETKEENRQTHERIEQDRRFETQAAIVRVMKARKTIGHADLVAEVIKLTRKRGPVDAAAIKKEIESLIDKDYIEREGKSYSYVA